MLKIIFFLWISFSLAIALFFFLLTAPEDKSNYKFLEVVSGSGFRKIAENLYKNGLIRSPKAFLIYGALSGSAHQLKPGNYFLSSGSSTPAILNVLARGPVIEAEITFPEGVTLKDIDKILSDRKILPAGALAKFPSAKSLEGFLFPDTYRFFLNSMAEAVVRKFLDNFEKKAIPIISNFQFPISNEITNARELLIVASLLEKEAPDFRDRQIIAGIFYKRLAAGVGLHVDATITYAKCAGAFLTCADPKVYRKDLVFESPYNTYLYNGLPPGPIGNPGLEAIKAALNPTESDYWYYLSDPKTKNTIFSKDLEEHLDNRVKYLNL